MSLHTPEATIQMNAADFAAGVAQLKRYENGQTVATDGQHASAAIVLAAQTEFLTQLAYAHKVGNIPADATGEDWVWQQVCIAGECVIGGNVELADEVGMGELYRATQQAVRDLVKTSRPVERDREVLPPGGVELEALPAIPVGVYWTVTVLGSVAVAAYAWWSTDKNEKDSEVAKYAAAGATDVARYQAWLDAKWKRREPIGPPPESVQALATEAGQSTWWALGTGAAFGILAAVGIAAGLKTPRARRTIARVSNPRRRVRRLAPAPKRRRVRRKRNAKKVTTKKKAASKPTRRRNPRAAHKYEVRVTRGGKRIVVSRHKTKKAAEKALKRAEAKHRSGGARIAQANPAKKTARKIVKRKRNAKKKATKKRAPVRKRNAKKAAKKRAPARKRNARKVPKRGFPKARRRRAA